MHCEMDFVFLVFMNFLWKPTASRSFLFDGYDLAENGLHSSKKHVNGEYDD
jgi:hypothetical protein